MNRRAALAPALLITACAGCASSADPWIIDSHAEWEAASSTSTGVVIVDGTASPTASTGTFTSTLKRFATRRRAAAITIEQSAAWQNWEPIENLGPANLRDAPVLLSLGPGNHWMFGRYGAVPSGPGRSATVEGFDVPLVTTSIDNVYDAPGGLREGLGGYHAWQSRDMKTWVHHGPVTERFSRWVTSAEAVGDTVYLFYDYPNDQDPHVYADDDLFDGTPGRDLGLAFDDPSHGSDAGVIRDLDGRFHLIYEDWSPIDASKRSWDSPLAGHAVADGPQGFEIREPAVDHRTRATGEIRTYEHPHWAQHPAFDTNVGEYERHEPAQDAYGDWAVIGIGGRSYLFGDYDPAGGHAMKCAWFTSRSIDEPFEFCGAIGEGHPDPDVCFADGRFYLVTQQDTDWVSDGPWVPRVEVRVGVDTTNDGRVDAWSAWREVEETYRPIEGFSKQVARVAASASLDELPAGYGFRFELRITDVTQNESRPLVDRIALEFSS